MILLKQMIVLFIMMMIGFFLAKKDVLDAKTSKKLSWIVVNLCNPALMIAATFGEKVERSVLLQATKASLVLYAILLVFGLALPYILRDGKNKSYTMMIVFGNVGFMGYPLIASMYGQGAILPASIFNLFYSVLMYTYGIMVISGEKFNVANLKKLINPGIIAAIIEIILYFGNITLPDFICDSVEMISGLTAPLSMLVIGSTFVSLSFKKLFTDVRILLFTLIRLIILPLLLFPLFKLFITDEVLLGVCLVMIAVPVGSMNVMMAQQYNGDVETSSKGVAITTILAVLTMPFLFMILM